ncbi:MAG: Ig-like domain-containing protein, partial [Gemmatimonadota bacterium]
GREITWTTLPAGVVTVSESGLVTATREGVVEVIAKSEGIQGNSRISVTPPPVAAVAIAPATPNVSVGETVTLEVTLTDRHGKKLAGREVRWHSAAEQIATVSNRGVVTGLTEGTAEISASSEEKQAATKVRVTAAPVASVTVPEPKPIVAGDTNQLQATIKDARGTALSGRAVKWTSSSPGLATVTRDGHLTGMAPGSAKITAECEGKSWTIPITVLPVPAASVVIEGKVAPLTIGASATLTAVVKDEKGRVLPGREVAWTSSATKVAAVTPAGVVTAKAAGEAAITASAEGRKAEMRITVTAPAPAAPAEPVRAAPVVAPPVVPVADVKTEIITPPPREVAPVQRAEVVERAPVPVPSSGGKGKLIGAVAALVVIAGIGFAVLGKKGGGGGGELPPAPNLPLAAVAVASVEIVGAEGTLAIGRTEQLAARLKDAAGAEISGRKVAWSSSEPAVAEVSPVGAVTAHKAGIATIVALSEGRADSFNLVVEQSTADQPAAVASLTLTGGGKALEVGETVQLQATPKDGKGAALSDRTVVWSASDPQVVLVSSSGLVSAVGPGSATISASSEGKSAESKLTVNAPKPAPKPPEPQPKPVEPQPVAIAVASVSVTPNSLSLIAGAEASLVAVLLDDKRRPLAERKVTWKSSDERIARVSNDGVVSGIAKGKVTITASAEGKSASAAVTVSEATVTVAAVGLIPTAKSLKVGESATWSAVARDAKGKELPDRPIAWSSSAPGVASVTPRGVVTGVAAGTADIRAEAEGKSESARLTVVAPPAPVPVVTNPKPNPPPVTAPTTTNPPPTTTGGNAALLPRRAIEAGGSFACGIAQSGAVCWGAGAGLTLIEGTSGISEITMGRSHACGLLAGGRAVCWGDNKQG